MFSPSNCDTFTGSSRRAKSEQPSAQRDDSSESFYSAVSDDSKSSGSPPSGCRIRHTFIEMIEPVEQDDFWEVARLKQDVWNEPVEQDFWDVSRMTQDFWNAVRLSFGQCLCKVMRPTREFTGGNFNKRVIFAMFSDPKSAESTVWIQCSRRSHDTLTDTFMVELDGTWSVKRGEVQFFSPPGESVDGPPTGLWCAQNGSQVTVTAGKRNMPLRFSYNTDKAPLGHCGCCKISDFYESPKLYKSYPKTLANAQAYLKPEWRDKLREALLHNCTDEFGTPLDYYQDGKNQADDEISEWVRTYREVERDSSRKFYRKLEKMAGVIFGKDLPVDEKDFAEKMESRYWNSMSAV